MSKEFGLCPECKKGELRPEGKRGVDSEPEGEFRQIAAHTDLICDNCGHMQKNREQNEYVKASDSVEATVTRRDDSNESPSDA